MKLKLLVTACSLIWCLKDICLPSLVTHSQLLPSLTSQSQKGHNQRGHNQSVEGNWLCLFMTSQNDKRLTSLCTLLHNFCITFFVFLKGFVLIFFWKAPLVMKGQLHHWNTISWWWTQSLSHQLNCIRQDTLRVRKKMYSNYLGFKNSVSCFKFCLHVDQVPTNLL